MKERVSSDTRILTEETYETLNAMLSSKDEGDHKMAQLILNQLDIQASIYWIWKLAKVHCNKMVNLRIKASRQFRDDCNLFALAYHDSQEFGVWLQSKGWLTHDLYQLLKGGIKDRIRRNTTNPFYDFHITIKDDHRHLDPDDELTQLRK